jgi:cysteinyl-tRNA synthetase
MDLNLYNTLTRTKERFAPLDPKNVRMYVCGPTVYDFAHIGNARPVIVFDVLYRLLRHLYGPEHVTYVRNITDVDDKINARALRDHPDLPLNEAIRRVTETTANQFFADAKALGCLEPTVQPRATDNIDEMIEMIKRLIYKGHAYEAGGEVLFSVPSMRDYGQLSQRKLEDQQAGARVAVEAHKEHPADFVLWKQSAKDEPGWHSPWGRGRPGWHIECSAMAHRYLGEVFDIHGGGLDLIFPHHENEIAQTRCSFDSGAMANVWMHNGFLQVEGQKMSKSLGNFVTISDVLGRWGGDVVRFNMLKRNYKEPIDWTERGLQESWQTLIRWRDAIATVTETGNPSGDVVGALADDLNTHKANTFLHSLFAAGDVSTLKASLVLLGYELSESSLRCPPFAQTISVGGIFSSEAHGSASITVVPSKDTIETLITARLEARNAKNWTESDRIRDELLGMGVAIKDNKDGTTSWEVKR